MVLNSQNLSSGINKYILEYYPYCNAITIKSYDSLSPLLNRLDKMFDKHQKIDHISDVEKYSKDFSYTWALDMAVDRVQDDGIFIFLYFKNNDDLVAALLILSDK